MALAGPTGEAAAGLPLARHSRSQKGVPPTRRMGARCQAIDRRDYGPLRMTHRGHRSVLGIARCRPSAEDQQY